MKQILSALLAVLLCLTAACGAAEAGGTHARTITRFELYRNGDIAYDSYEIAALGSGYRVSVNGGESQSIDDETVDALCRVVEAYDLFKWDGFDRERSDVLDGEGFRLEIDFADGTSIRAQGDNAFPENYFAAIGEMQEILDGAGASRPAALRGFLERLGTLMSPKRERVVGTDIAFEDITEFYYTYESSTALPEYQRYRFYVEDGKRLFYHETREGGGFPLTEEDITVSGTVALSEASWAAFCACVEGGTVRKREESLDDGDAGPWLYLYWNGDLSVYQEFSFASWGARADFEALCAALRDAPEGCNEGSNDAEREERQTGTG